VSRAIHFDAVAKRYGDVSVIPDLTLHVAAGESLVLLGPSGCGKSTLLRMLAGLEPVSAGTIRIDGEDVTQRAPGQRGVAMVFQQYALYPHMSVFDNMAFGLRNVRLAPAEIRRRIDDAARILELTPLLQRRPVQLSGGQRQRVAIGRALVKEPAAFLFDEPLSNLDAKLRVRTRIELARLHQRLQATMLFVTHDQVEAMTLASRIAVMNGGCIDQVAPPLEVYHRPATRFVAGFVGSPGMNFLPVKALSAGPGGRLEATLADGTKLPTQLRADAAAADAAGAELGIRPEALRLAAADANEAGAMRARIEVIERLGERTLAHLSLADGTPIVAEAPQATTARPGDNVSLVPDPTRLHLFDAAGHAHHPQPA
jgi:multiple sugar transport system ATP-binding protein